MDEHMAALALTSLSCSPASPILQSHFASFQRMPHAVFFYCSSLSSLKGKSHEKNEIFKNVR